MHTHTRMHTRIHTRTHRHTHGRLFHPADAPLLSPAGERNSPCVYSRVDVTACAGAGAGAGAASSRHTAFARARPHEATLRRGDLLYLPLGWWHAVRGSHEYNLSVNFWFGLHPSKRDEARPEEGMEEGSASGGSLPLGVGGASGRL